MGRALREGRRLIRTGQYTRKIRSVMKEARNDFNGYKKRLKSYEKRMRET